MTHGERILDTLEEVVSAVFFTVVSAVFFTVVVFVAAAFAYFGVVGMYRAAMHLVF